VDVANRGIGSIALKIGIAGAVGFGAIATGMVVSRKGRNLLREAWQGRQRTTLEDRVLDVLWGERDLSRRPLDVHEGDAGIITVRGTVFSDDEYERCLDLVAGVSGVRTVLDGLDVERPPERQRGARSLARQIHERARSRRGS
jgi:hypothetical protein